MYNIYKLAIYHFLSLHYYQALSLLPCHRGLPTGPSTSAFILHALFSDRLVLLKYVRSCHCFAQNTDPVASHFSLSKRQILSLPLLLLMSILAVI